MKTEPIPKYQRKALEKIWNLLQEIEERRQLTSPEDDIKLPYVPPGFSGTKFALDDAANSRTTIIKKLIHMDALMDFGNTEGIDGYIFFKVGPQYKIVFKMYEGQYKNASRDYIQTDKPEKEIVDPVYEIKYSRNGRDITINNFVIARPQSFNENESAFFYIYKHPNQRILKKQIEAFVEQDLGKKLTKTIPKIIENLGFKGDFKRAFFDDVSVNGIYLRNPVKKADLNQKGIKYLDIHT